MGTADGLKGRLGSCEVWVVPGVPEEARVMLEALAGSLPLPAPGHEWERIVATAGLRETAVAERLERAGFRPPEGIALGFLPSPGGVVLRLAARPAAPSSALASAESAVRDVLGDDALPEPSLAASLVRVLREAGATFATAESCTGGLLGATITDVPGASSVYLGGVVAYSDGAKTDLLGVAPSLLEEHGAVSEAVARAMAGGCRRRFRAALAVAVTGIAGPTGGSPEKPVGTVCVGIDGGGAASARTFRFGGTRELVRERSVGRALEMAYRRARAGAR
jgi:nicotinamide-nucleotide amidase